MQANLYYRNGTSDKVYHLAIRRRRTSNGEEIYRVEARYGRRALPTRQEHNANFSTYHDAVDHFVKTVKEKMRKGYRDPQIDWDLLEDSTVANLLRGDLDRNEPDKVIEIIKKKEPDYHLVPDEEEI